MDTIVVEAAAHYFITHSKSIKMTIQITIVGIDNEGHGFQDIFDDIEEAIDYLEDIKPEEYPLEPNSYNH